MSDKPKAIVLLSGGLDSSTVLAIASQQYKCHTISFDYHQRAEIELVAAEAIAVSFHASHQVIRLDDGVMAGSALTDTSIDVPEVAEEAKTHEVREDVKRHMR